MAKKKTSWDMIQDQQPQDTTQYRDVYEDQQLERSQIGEKQTATSRIILCLIVAALVGVVAYFTVGLIRYGISTISSLTYETTTTTTTSEESGTSSSGDVLTYNPDNPYNYTTVVVDWAEGEDGLAVMANYYTAVDEYGNIIDATALYLNIEDVPVPDWYVQSKAEYEAAQVASEATSSSTSGIYDEYYDEVTETSTTSEDGSEESLSYYLVPAVRNWPNLVGFVLGFLILFAIMYPIMMRNLEAQNLLEDVSDINQYTGDQHIALPEEIMRKFDWFPDVGAHSAVSVSSMISHVALQNKGIKSIELTQRAEQDILDADGDIEYLEGEILTDDDGEYISKTLPMFDKDFMEDLFDASELPKDKKMRKYYDTTKIPYNPGNGNREKLKGYDSVADLINNDWEFPYYEVQRPGGAYIVDTAPVNTMVLAITRAGKGQTVIEPTLDMWTREKNLQNIVVNDPKGELLKKYYVPATYRGMQVVQFNLINSMNTDIYNPLVLASQSARESDFSKVAMYVNNIADVFFPVTGGDDPVWPNAANNAFKRAAYGLMDFYLEEEAEMRLLAQKKGMDEKTFETQIDTLWGHNTLYNCYELFVNLTSKKVPNPSKEFTEAVKEAEAASKEKREPRTDAAKRIFQMNDDEYDEELARIEKMSNILWENKPEIDMLTLYFNASKQLPRNQMRTLVSNADDSLRSMGGAEKMMASVYGIAITAMSFFTDPTIRTLTSGTPSQNVDLAGISFPRRLGFQLNADFVAYHHLKGMQCVWQAYEDPEFKKSLGKDFSHSDLITIAGWARFYFKGIFPKDTAYLKCEIQNPQTSQLLRTFYFKFVKSYQTSLDGRTYVKDPILGEKIVRDGILTELRPFKDKKTGKTVYKKGNVTFTAEKVREVDNLPVKEKVQVRAITQLMQRYSEKPKMIFLVTPPHLMSYAKLILILIKQLVDLNFDQSYMTKSDQKPLYKTRFMLDELGNLQSEGHGIDGFETMLSIGLGQEQQFTLILQTLQQLRDVYGESVDKIVQGNAQVLDALLATPNGWVRMGDIKVGDEVYTADGYATKVLGVYPRGKRPVYRVTLRDGSSTKVCNEHLWEIERWKTSIRYLGGRDENGKRRIAGAGKGGKSMVRVTEVINTEELKSRIEKKQGIDLPFVKPVEYPKADLPMDSYVLGVILGDAHITKEGQVTIDLSAKKQEIVDELCKRGFEITITSRSDGHKQLYVKNVCRIIRNLGLAGHNSPEKFIPSEYLYASVEQRIDLLRGLMDTDGYISKKSEMEYTTASEQLAKDVQELIRSLGGRVDINVKQNVMYTSPTQKTPKKARDAYRLQNIRLKGINPFLLSYKAERWQEREKCESGNYGYRVVNVEYVGEEEVQCILVEDPRHLYLTDDYIPTHNTSNIVFLKSTDDDMISTLEKMSGTRHVVYKNSKTITRDIERIVMRNEGKASYTMTTVEEPVIKYNDMAFISQRNSIIFRAGDSPVWNRNETILPMAWRLHQKTIKHPGHDYTFQTVPTLSSAKEFDVRKNVPDFDKMVDKRVKQAMAVEDAKRLYKEQYEYSDLDIERLDPDLYAADIMELINSTINSEFHADDNVEDNTDIRSLTDDDLDYYDSVSKYAVPNEEQRVATNEAQAKYAASHKNLYAGKQLSKASFKENGIITRNLEKEIIEAYKEVRGDFEQDTANFLVRNGSLYSSDGKTAYIRMNDESEGYRQMMEAAKDENSRVYAEEDFDKDELAKYGTYTVTDDFYEFLISMDSWKFANGRFDAEMARRLKTA